MRRILQVEESSFSEASYRWDRKGTYLHVLQPVLTLLWYALFDLIPGHAAGSAVLIGLVPARLVLSRIMVKGALFLAVWCFTRFRRVGYNLVGSGCTAVRAGSGTISKRVYYDTNALRDLMACGSVVPNKPLTPRRSTGKKALGEWCLAVDRDIPASAQVQESLRGHRAEAELGDLLDVA